MRESILVATGLLALLAAAVPAEAAELRLKLKVLSNRADLISAGEALVDQADATAWLSYQDGSGSVVYGGRSLGPAPAGSGGGWTSKAFDSWRQG